MSRLAMIFGGVLIFLGVGFYVALLGMAGPDDKVSPTTLIPVAFGLPILVCGVIARSEKYRMHAMHGAALFGILGTLGGLGMGLPKIGQLLGGTAERPLAIVLQLLLGVVCLIFVTLCVQSFIQARKDRQIES